MGLNMKERDSITKEIANRYKNARKKEKKLYSMNTLALRALIENMQLVRLILV
ncbi:MAG: hypothetical protein ACTTIZ_08875 [Treponema sp.]